MLLLYVINYDLKNWVDESERVPQDSPKNISFFQLGGKNVVLL